ncbi:uncharacterized protein LOC117647141 [Thrips palmi]|uniref:Uncharacterized protein LOC117647141 n=1 Tax=Thrips palmi TaxID=161013 RepID=A0A6P8Z3G6_THRPL|nr:uncharacterized protein LOC117647141 [Thrips palmi]XP_034244586.1 uncharacterized protein LOC117647141 [Thrips palmi]XP_034244587.1 uncharacterized protein LOC117647141 [Thrips palmi]XP_034244588.1 uncharacterized protein LOC117647141 [Thrips palmi]XP_034244589.1 uncharacterized protein LOC117647141 [Thrips palmi]XP_034244590.1 uncharacterized protein LOC117647141 [Thrips palmi]XP_034244592.1 uncharacterized protein LOC117647141 [Thrips palmi]XP_034244593.1 uncharacterized protein LOC1176
MSSGQIDEAIAEVASAVARLQQRLQQDDAKACLADTITCAMQSDSQSEDRRCKCDKIDGVVDGDSSEVHLVVRYLLTVLRKQGMLNQVCSVCTPSQETVIPVCKESEELSGDEEEGGVGQEQEAEAALVLEQPNVEEAEEEEESLEDEEEEEEEDDTQRLDVHNAFLELQRRVTLDLSSLSKHGPDDLAQAKVSLLAPHMLEPVRKLIHLYCDVDSAWVLQLLYDLAPQLEELQMSRPSKAHLEVMETMPQLSRLDIEYYNGSSQSYGSQQDSKTASNNYVFKRLPARHCGLRFLRVGHMPKKSTLSLIRTHRKTLEELWMSVGSGSSPGSTGMSEGDGWPENCLDLHEKLGRYAAEGPLKRLVLFRWLYAHDGTACLVQIHALRQALPGVDVLCRECDKISFSDF